MCCADRNTAKEALLVVCTCLHTASRDFDDHWSVEVEVEEVEEERRGRLKTMNTL